MGRIYGREFESSQVIIRSVQLPARLLRQFPDRGQIVYKMFLVLRISEPITTTTTTTEIITIIWRMEQQILVAIKSKHPNLSQREDSDWHVRRGAVKVAPVG